MGFFGVGQRAIGSRHLHDYAVVDRTITDDSVGSQSLSVSAIAYESQIKDNILGFGLLTPGLQGSFSSGVIGTVPMDKLELRFEHGETGTLQTYNWQDRNIGSFSTTPYFDGITYRPDKKALAYLKNIGYNNCYIVTVGTSGNSIGSIRTTKLYSPRGITLATDKNRYWMTEWGYNHIYQLGTTTGNVIGSFNSPGNNPWGIAYADDLHRLWVASNANKYIYEIGTTTGNKIGSFKVTGGSTYYGLAISPDKHKLWVLDYGAEYIHEIGTTNKNDIGSFKGPPMNFNPYPHPTFSTDKNRLWMGPAGALERYIFEMGTAFGRAYNGTYVKFAVPFSLSPTVTVGKIDNLGNSNVFSMSPNVGSFWVKAGSYPERASWMAWGSR